MKMLKKCFLWLLTLSMVATAIPSASADFSFPRFWDQPTDAYVVPYDNASGAVRDIGAAADEIPNGYFTNLSVSGLFTFGGAMASDLDLDGYDLILDTDGDTALVNDRDAGVADDNIDVKLGGTAYFNFRPFTFETKNGGSIELVDDSALVFGAGNDAIRLWETADANANALILTLPEGDATNVPVMVVGDASAAGVDLGLFDGITDPTVAILSDDQTKYLALSQNGTDSLITSSAGGFGFNTSVLGGAVANFVGLEGVLHSTSDTDATNKGARFGTLHYTIAEEPFYIFSSQSTNLVNQVNLGGGTSVGNAATDIKFFTASNNTTITGTERMNIDNAGQLTVFDSGGTKEFTVEQNGTNTLLQDNSGQIVLNAPGGIILQDSNVSALVVTNDATKTTITPTTGDYLRIGDAGTTSHSLNTSDDVLHTGKTELDGQTFFDNTALAGDNVGMTFGNSSDAVLSWRTNQATSNTFVVGLGDTSNSMILTQTANIGKDHDFAAQANPTVAIFNATDPDVSNNLFGSATHDGSNFVISGGANVGTGSAPVTANNGIQIAPQSLTSGGVDNFGIEIVQTLNDATAAGGSDVYTMIRGDLTETDITSWDTVNLLDLRVGGTSKFTVSDNGSVSISSTASSSLVQGVWRMGDSGTSKWGDQSDTSMSYSSARNALHIGVGSGDGNRMLAIMENSDVGTSLGLGAHTDPTLCIFSSDITDVTKRGCISHDEADFNIDSFTGSVKVGSTAATGVVLGRAGQTVTIGASSILQGSTNSFSGDIIFVEGNASPGITHTARTTDASVTSTTLTAQDAFQSVAALTNAGGGNMIFDAGDGNLLDTVSASGGGFAFIPGRNDTGGNGEDGVFAVFGAGEDATSSAKSVFVFHNLSDAFVKSNTGDLYLLPSLAGADVVVGDATFDARLNVVGTTGGTNVAMRWLETISTAAAVLQAEFGTDSLVWGLGDNVGKQVVMTSETSGILQDYDHASGDVTLYLQSDLAPNTDNGEFLGLSYLGLQAGTMETDRAAFSNTISAVNAFVQVAASTNPDGGNLVLEAGNANTSDTTAGDGGSVQIKPGKEGAAGPGQIEFYNNKADNNLIGAIFPESGTNFGFGVAAVTDDFRFGFNDGATWRGLLHLNPVATAVNYFEIANAATGGAPVLAALGSDTNIDIDATPQGTGDFAITSGGLRVEAGRIQGLQGADVASGSTIAITEGNSAELTGTTAVNLITSTGWQEGSTITLICNESVTINHGTATSGANITILLAGAGNFSCTANDTISFILGSTTAGGVAWRETARTVI